ncbi:MAG: laccase domain-containing protein [Planctomycetes bacterium]|nr:laccase domain-containing protein [Planctomycetota bacterium]
MKPLRLIDQAESLRSCCDIEDLMAWFPDRWGGVSEPPFATLNLGFSTGDDPDAVRENRHRLLTEAGIPLEQLVVPGQIHGAEVGRVSRRDGGEGATEPSRVLAAKDVLILDEPGVFVLSLSADCPLVAIADPHSRRAGIAHCGWRGTVAGALPHLIEELEPGPRSVAMVSPAISRAHYRVEKEVSTPIRALPGGQEACRDGSLDLRIVLRSQLHDGGFDDDRIAMDRRCSAENPDLFSHRGDGGRTGRGGFLLGWNC